MKMNLPNRLTIARIVLVPFFVFFYLSKLVPAPYHAWIALVIFVAASLTDTFDGHIARRDNLITDFGKFMDPLADKLLVCSAMICFVETGKMPAWTVIILIGREFVISGFRLVAASKGNVIAANVYGKIKTIVQMIMIIALLIPIEHTILQVLQQILIYASVILTLLSVIIYIKDNLWVLNEEKS